MSAMWRVNLILALNRSLLNKKHTLRNVLKALALIISMCSLYAILLSKIIPRYLTWLMKVMIRPFNARWVLGGGGGEANKMRKVAALILIFIEFYVSELIQNLNSVETSLQVSENHLRGLWHIYRSHQKRDVDRYQVFGSIIYTVYMCTCTMWDAGQNLMVLLPVYPVAWIFHLWPRLWIISEK
jgi:hypothetical protein